MIYGCIGEHLPHSFSKIIHEKIENYNYILKELTPSEIAPFMLNKEFSGINVTIPYKETVIPYLDEIDSAAQAIGAVNTVVNKNGKLYGYNTDYAGLKALIAKTGLLLQNKKIIIIGMGGTAKTAHAVCKDCGASEILHITRTGKSGSLTYQQAYAEHSNANIVINTSPCGMFPKIDTLPVDSENKPFAFDAFPVLEGAIDVVYNPLRTRFILEAQNKGLVAEGGLYMLVAQAVFAAEHFTGKTYPTALIDDIFNSLVSEKENIVLIGMPGSGKSTLSKILSQSLGCSQIDTDALIVKKIGMPISDYFAKYGEEAFRTVESEVIREVAGTTHSVIATGGGAILKEENVTALKQNGKLYFLDRPLESLIPTQDRPTASDAEALKKRYQERYAIYVKTADEVITDFSSPEITACQIETRHKNK